VLLDAPAHLIETAKVVEPPRITLLCRLFEEDEGLAVVARNPFAVEINEPEIVSRDRKASICRFLIPLDRARIALLNPESMLIAVAKPILRFDMALAGS